MDQKVRQDDLLTLSTDDDQQRRRQIDLETKRLLLLDDDEDAFLLTQALLGRVESKYELDWVPDVSEATERISQRAYDAYLIDYRLGEKTGVEFLNDNGLDALTGPVLIFTGFDEGAIEADAFTAGVAQFISKDDLTGDKLDRTIRYAISAWRERREAELSSLRDVETGLPNRKAMYRAIELARIAISEGSESGFAVLAIHIERYALFQASLGYRNVTDLLRRIGERLSKLCLRLDFVAHLERADFAAVIRDCKSADVVKEIATDARRVIDQPFSVNSIPFSVSARIGCAIATDARVIPGNILDEATTASRQVNRSSSPGDFLTSFTASMRVASEDFLRTQWRLRSALRDGHLQAYLQPIVDLRNRRVRAFEALLRWPQPDGTVLLPDDFWGVAEMTGQLVDLDRWMIATAIHQYSRIFGDVERSDLPALQINISPETLMDPGLVPFIQSHLRGARLTEDTLVLEISERQRVEDPDWIAAELTVLTESGIRVSLDDFGTGFSSLSHLHKLPFHEIKLEREFLTEAADSKRVKAIMRALHVLTSDMGIDLTVEGVETFDHLRLVSELNVRFAQGFIFGRPLPIIDARRELNALLGGRIGEVAEEMRDLD